MSTPADILSSSGAKISEIPGPDQDAITSICPTPLGDSNLSGPPGHEGAGETRVYQPPATEPTQLAELSIRFDFNLGARVLLPQGRNYRVRLSDVDTGNTLFESTSGATFVNSTKRYFVRVRIQVWDGDDCILTHDYDAHNRDVLIQFPVGTLGDILAWFPYAARFRDVHGCHLTCAMSDQIIPLLRDVYPGITFVTHGEVRPEMFYATYHMGLFFDDADNVWQPCDFRHVGLHRTAAYILGVDPAEEPPRIALTDDSRPIPEPYVCIGVQSSTQSKYWNNPIGWGELTQFFKQHGYRVICIDQRPVHGQGLVWNHIPHGAEDETGARPLQERARWLRHATLFAGLSSGLSWLAWAVGTKVVLISGFTHPTNEFVTPYRVINYHACNSCWNDVRHRFNHKDFLWCPRHQGTPRQFECTRLITVAQVIRMIRTVPGFGTHQRLDTPIGLRGRTPPRPR